MCPYMYPSILRATSFPDGDYRQKGPLYMVLFVSLARLYVSFDPSCFPHYISLFINVFIYLDLS